MLSRIPNACFGVSFEVSSSRDQKKYYSAVFLDEAQVFDKVWPASLFGSSRVSFHLPTSILSTNEDYTLATENYRNQLLLFEPRLKNWRMK